MNFAPNKVSGRVVKISSSLSPLAWFSDRAQNAPAGLPSGRSSSSASAALFPASDRACRARRAAYRRILVMANNHCVSSRCSTNAPERQPRPSITCSLASTVLSTGSQFNFRLFRVRPRPASAQEIEKHFLLVLVIGRIASRDLAAPVERQPHRLELFLHRRDVVVGPRLGMDLALHGGVLGRHAEGVPAHRVQHRKSHRPLHPRHHVAHGVIAHVAHMDAARTGRETSPARSTFCPETCRSDPCSAWRRCRARPRLSASGLPPRRRCSGRSSLDQQSLPAGI